MLDFGRVESDPDNGNWTNLRDGSRIVASVWCPEGNQDRAYLFAGADDLLKAAEKYLADADLDTLRALREAIAACKPPVKPVVNPEDELVEKFERMRDAFISEMDAAIMKLKEVRKND
jgi:hypothetical protein